MNPDYYGVVEMLFSFGVVLAFASWQWIDLRKTKRRLREKNRSKK